MRRRAGGRRGSGAGSKRVLQPKLDLPHWDLKRSERPEACRSRRRRSDAGRWSAKCRMISEIERLKAEREAMAFSHTEALVGSEIPILLARSADHVPTDIADHALRRNHHGSRVEPLASRWTIEFERLAGSIGSGAILKRQRVPCSGGGLDQPALEANDRADLP